MKGIALFLHAFALTLVLVLPPFVLAQEGGTSGAGVEPRTQQVNINMADAQTLSLLLDGIGPAKARAIVTYREENGAFSSLEELLMVRGIGEVTVRSNQDRILFEDAPEDS